MERAGLRDETGVALIVSILVLLMISAIGIAAVDRAGDDAKVTGHAKADARALYAADAGIGVALNRLAGPIPDLTPFNVDLDDGVSVRSGTRAASAPEPIAYLGTAGPPDGYSLVIGSGFISKTYRVNVTGFGTGASRSELEAKLTRLSSSGGSY